VFERLKKIGVFSKLSFSFIKFFFILTLINLIISTQLSKSIIMTEAYNNNALLLNKMSGLIENKIEDFNKAVYSFSLEIGADRADQNIANLYQRWNYVYRGIEEIGANYDFIDSVYIFYNKGQNVYYQSLGNGYNGILNTHDFFDRDIFQDFNSSKRISYETGLRAVDTEKFKGMNKAGKITKVFSFIKRIPTYSLNTKNGLIINVKENYLSDLIKANYIPPKSSLIISYSSGDIIFAYNENAAAGLSDTTIQEIMDESKGADNLNKSFSIPSGKDKVFVTQVKSDMSDRVYMLIVPENELMKPISKVNVPIFIMSNLLFIIAVIFSSRMDVKFFQPVLGILRTLKANRSIMEIKEEGNQKAIKNNEFAEISSYIDNIIIKNSVQQKQLAEYKREMQRYFSSYKERVLYEVLIGNKETQDMIEEDKVFLSSDLKWFIVILVNIKIDGKQELEIIDTIQTIPMFEKVISILSEYGYVEKIQINKQQVAFLLGMKHKQDIGELSGELEISIDRMDQLDLMVHIGIGSLYDEIGKISRSYSEARNKLYYMTSINKSSVFHVIQEDYQETRANYPYEVENEITFNVQKGNLDEIKDGIKRFSCYLRENSILIDRSKKYWVILIHNIIMQIYSVYKIEKSDLKDNDIYNYIEELDTESEIEDWMLYILDKCINLIKSSSIYDNKDLIDKVIDYINDHYMENINLNTIAEYVYLTPGYLSKVFKSFTKETFNSYVINVRMNKVAELLTNSDMNVTEISEKVGYNSVRSLIKTFKSYFNCTPTEYRKRTAVNFLDKK